MLPIPRTATLKGQGQGNPGHHPTSSATAPLVALLALLAVCVLSAAARRLYSLILGGSSSGAALSSAAPLPAPPRRGRRGGGMDPAEVGSLPVRAYDYDGGGAVDVCAVCLGELQAKERVKAIPACGHIFHPPCIDRWLLAGRASCPLCRCSAAATTLKHTQLLHGPAASAASSFT